MHSPRSSTASRHGSVNKMASVVRSTTMTVRNYPPSSRGPQSGHPHVRLAHPDANSEWVHAQAAPSSRVAMGLPAPPAPAPGWTTFPGPPRTGDLGRSASTPATAPFVRAGFERVYWIGRTVPGVIGTTAWPLRPHSVATHAWRPPACPSALNVVDELLPEDVHAAVELLGERRPSAAGTCASSQSPSTLTHPRRRERTRTQRT